MQELASRAGDISTSVKTEGQWGDKAALHSPEEITPVCRGLKDQCITPSRGESPRAAGRNTQQLQHLVLRLLSTLLSKKWYGSPPAFPPCCRNSWHRYQGCRFFCWL